MEKKVYTISEIDDIFNEVEKKETKVDKVIPKDFDLNCYNQGGRTLLTQFINRYPTVKEVLKMGADPNIYDLCGYFPIHCAIDEGEIEVVDLLLKYGADINAKNNYGKTILHLITLFYQNENKEELFFKYLSKGADINIKDKNNLKPHQYGLVESNPLMLCVDEKLFLSSINSLSVDGCDKLVTLDNSNRLTIIGDPDGSYRFWLACVLFPTGFLIKKPQEKVKNTLSNEERITNEVNPLEEKVRRLETMVHTLLYLHGIDGDFNKELVKKGYPKLETSKWFDIIYGKGR